VGRKSSSAPKDLSLKYVGRRDVGAADADDGDVDDSDVLVGIVA
jgi:hypothetical protein